MTSFLSIAGVSKTYSSPRGDVHALENVDLDIDQGEFVSVLGPSGCGKSTLMKCIGGLEESTTGEIRLNGAVLDGPPKDLGVVFQRDLLLDWYTILQNVLLTARFKRLAWKGLEPEARRLLASFGLANYEHRHPWELSGGMRQRAAICRALVDNPSVLLMDEPFGALDAMTRDELNTELQRIWLSSRKTVVFITHSIPEAVFLSDRIVVMAGNPGRIVAQYHVEIPRPRRLSVRGSAEFARYIADIHSLFSKFGVLKAD